MPHCLCIGHGYSARAFARRLKGFGWRVSGTTRSPDRARQMEADGVHPIILDSLDKEWRGLDEPFAMSDAVLVSAAPDEDGDPALNTGLLQRAARSAPQWIGYLSTVGVYGNHDGAWVDETSECRPVSARSTRRVAAEKAWLAEASDARQVHVFRLSGIYGPGRSPLKKVARGEGRAIIKLGQVFNRIHVADIAATLLASLKNPAPGRIYNVTDDEPAPPQDVVNFAADLLGLPRPPQVPFEEAEMTEMGRSFYGENKRVRNLRIRHELGVDLAFPTYREGIGALWAAGRAAL